MDERWVRLCTLVEEASELPGAERTAYVVHACGDDPALRDEVLGLLAAGLEDDDFLESPLRPTPQAPGRLGPYRILRVLGQGGMGTVYEAEQEAPRRRVALKTIHASFLRGGSASSLQREAELLAQLRHPAIAQVYATGIERVEAAGLDQEIPWLAMEYVDGARTIVEHAAAGDLDVEGRVRLFVRVCDAVQHGHRNGVIHRDLKPDNLLVSRDGHPKVIDFGVARLLDRDRVLDTLRTQVSEIAGTVAYMSPEQVAGDGATVDTRADVYALGVVLYELLLGRLPIDVRGTGFLTAAQRICDEPPRRPRTLDRGLDADLEAILLKALAKDPARRYVTGAGLGADLERWLAREPVVAQPPRLTYQVRAFARRHRALVVSAVAILLASVAGTVVSLGFAVRSRRAEEATSRAAQAAAAERDRTRGLLDAVLERSTAATARFAPRFLALPGGTADARDLMALTLEDLHALEEIAGGDPRVEVEVAHAHARLGDARGNPAFPNLGDREGAVASYERSLAIAERVVMRHPDDLEARYARVRALRKLGELAMAARDFETAGVRLATALAAAEDLCERAPDEPEYEAALGGVHDKLGGLASRQGDLDALRLHVAAYQAIFAGLHERHPTQPTYALHEALGHQQLAGLHWKEERFADARAAWQQAARGLEALLATDVANRSWRLRLAWNVMWAGSAAHRLGTLESAAEDLARARGMYEALLAEDPDNTQIPPDLANCLWCVADLAEARATEGDVAAAERRRLLEAGLEALQQGRDLLQGLEDRGALLPLHAGFLRLFVDRAASLGDRLAEPESDGGVR